MLRSHGSEVYAHVNISQSIAGGDKQMGEEVSQEQMDLKEACYQQGAHYQHEANYQQEAHYLAETYTDMLKERDRLQKRLNGNWTYTKDMAIMDLDSITVSFGKERVTSSSISNPTERIAMKLTDEYMAGKQKEMNRMKEMCCRDLEYVNWKIAVVETVVKERLTETGSDIFMLLYVGNKTYREAEGILQRKRKVKLTNRGVASLKEKIHAALCLELEFRSAIGKECENLNMLKKEAAEANTVKDSGNQGVMPYARAL